MTDENLKVKQQEELKKLGETIDFSSIPITDDFMFGYVMSDPERCKTFLEQIMQLKIDHVEYLEKQKTIDLAVDARSIRMDIYVDDGKTIYDCEMQTTSDKNLPKRTRYYQGQIDMNIISKGDDFKKLKKSFVIFICTFDPFGKGKYIYLFENMCKEDLSIHLDDGAYKIFINTKGKSGNVSDDFVELMDYFNNPDTVSSSKNPLIKELDDAVIEARTNKKWRHDYMTMIYYGNEKYREGLEEGLERGELKRSLEIYEYLIQNGTDPEEAQKITKLTDEELEGAYAKKVI